MGIITKTIRYSIPIAFTYQTVKIGLWSPAVCSPEAEERLGNHRKALSDQVDHLQQFIEPYLPQLKLEIPDVEDKWNQFVKKTMSSMVKFDASEAMKNLMKQLEDSSKPSQGSSGDPGDAKKDKNTNESS